MYQIKDIVELGHMSQTGGSVNITLHFNSIVEPKPYLELIDSLDHTVITTNAKLVEMSERYFLLSESKSLIEDIITVIANLVTEYERTIDPAKLLPCTGCTIQIGKVQFSSELIKFSKLIAMCNEG